MATATVPKDAFDDSQSAQSGDSTFVVADTSNNSGNGDKLNVSQMRVVNSVKKRALNTSVRRKETMKSNNIALARSLSMAKEEVKFLRKLVTSSKLENLDLKNQLTQLAQQVQQNQNQLNEDLVREEVKIRILDVLGEVENEHSEVKAAFAPLHAAIARLGDIPVKDLLHELEAAANLAEQYEEPLQKLGDMIKKFVDEAAEFDEGDNERLEEENQAAAAAAAARRTMAAARRQTRVPAENVVVVPEQGIREDKTEVVRRPTMALHVMEPMEEAENAPEDDDANVIHLDDSTEVTPVALHRANAKARRSIMVKKDVAAAVAPKGLAVKSLIDGGKIKKFDSTAPTTRKTICARRTVQDEDDEENDDNERPATRPKNHRQTMVARHIQFQHVPNVSPRHSEKKQDSSDEEEDDDNDKTIEAQPPPTKPKKAVAQKKSMAPSTRPKSAAGQKAAEDEDEGREKNRRKTVLAKSTRPPARMSYAPLHANPDNADDEEADEDEDETIKIAAGNKMPAKRKAASKSKAEPKAKAKAKSSGTAVSNGGDIGMDARPSTSGRATKTPRKTPTVKKSVVVGDGATNEEENQRPRRRTAAVVDSYKEPLLNNKLRR